MRQWLALFILAFSALACGSSGSGAGSSLSDPIPLKTTTTVGNAQVSVISINPNQQLKCLLGSCLADAGNKFVSVSLYVQCQSDSCTFDASDWMLADHNGVLHDSLDGDLPNYLGDLELVRDGKSGATLAFEVPEDGEPFTLVYDKATYFATESK